MTKTIPTADALARKFAENLKEDIGDAALAEVVRRNGDASYDETGSCASHDFCDANMTMLASLMDFGFTDDEVFESDENPLIAVWNEAWDLAKKNNFYIFEKMED